MTITMARLTKFDNPKNMLCGIRCRSSRDGLSQPKVTGGLPIDPVLGTWQIQYGLSALERIGHEALTILRWCGAAVKMQPVRLGPLPVEEASACFLLDVPLEGIP
jgi:hypothetical protein